MTLDIFWFTEYPRSISEDETFITEEEAAELIKQGWIQKYEYPNRI